MRLSVQIKQCEKTLIAIGLYEIDNGYFMPAEK